MVPENFAIQQILYVKNAVWLKKALINTRRESAQSFVEKTPKGFP